MAPDRKSLAERALAFVNRRLATYPLRSRPTGQPEFEPYWELLERKLALLIELKYPDARAYVKAQVRATRTGGKRRTFGWRRGRPGYIREWDVLLKWVSGPLKGKVTPVEVKSKREMLRSVEGGFRSPKIETRYLPRSAVARQLRKDLVTLPQADALELVVEDAVTMEMKLLTVETSELTSTHATAYGVLPDIETSTATGGTTNGARRVFGSFNGVEEGISFRWRPPPRVAPRVANQLETEAITTQLQTGTLRGSRASVGRRVVAGVRGFVAGLLLDIAIGLILGWIERESARRKIEDKLETAEPVLIQQMRDALDRERPDLTSIPFGSVLDLWFVVEIGFTYLSGAEGTPGGIGPLDEVYVSGETVPAGAYVPEAYSLNEVVLVPEKPEPPEDTGLPPDLVRIGVPFQFWNPGPDDLVGYWDLEQFSYLRPTRLIDHFELAPGASGLTMRHIGRELRNSKTRSTMPDTRQTGWLARAVSIPAYDRRAQTLRFAVIWQNPVLERAFDAFIPTDYYFQVSGVGVLVGAIVAPEASLSDSLFTLTRVPFGVRREFGTTDL